MKIIFLPYEHETIPMTSFAKSLRKKINHKQFFFISDFFSQISSNRYTNKIIKEHSYDDTQILDIYDEIKEISKIKENSKLINVDYNYLKNIESEFIDNTINQLIYKDCHFLDLYHPRDYYFVPKSKELKLKFVELIIKKIVKFLDQVSPEIVFSFGNNHLIRNIFFQLSKKYNYKFLNLAHTRFLNRYYFCENNKSTLTNNILTRANYLMKNKDEINFELVKKFINKIVDRIENNEGSYDVSNVYNSNEISLSFLKKIYQSNFFKRTRYLLKDIYISKKLSSHRGYFKPPYFGEKSYFETYIKNFRNVLRVTNFYRAKNLIYKGNFNFNFIYFTLHAFPENEVYANSGANNEIYYLTRISKLIPIDWKIVVKPSPLMFLSGADVHPLNFYEKINKIHNCLVVSPEENSNFLLKKSKATASIAGTNLMEGICLNKPAFRFGDYNLDFLNGIYKFDEKTFLTNLLKKDFNNISENSHLYQAIYEHSFEIDYDKYCYGYEEKNESDFIKKFIQPLVNNFLALKIF